ncbi:Cell division and transport-associated protein TolR [Nitrosomonas eutropha]|uniref:protein TolR n=1 Tax=Nitrosomonas TaxID=914 RepID=UPI00087F4E22|nr:MULTISPECIES: protein TolR [Nitrosomonas]SCX13043.1 Cell division and transport-associated protein TolR [Nitrosomonas eutropha]SDW15830.1 Cell division and transport-associated protein TolR [Nitrosomonas eutropha]
MIPRRSKRRLMNEINVVPYIDVMLVLLIIFMITAPLIQPSQIELPEIGKSSVPPAEPLEVTITANGNLTLRDRAGANREQQVNHNQLVELIKARQAQNTNQPVVIAADKNVRYEKVIQVMDMLQQQQIRKIGLLTKSK